MYRLMYACRITSRLIKQYSLSKALTIFSTQPTSVKNGTKEIHDSLSETIFGVCRAIHRQVIVLLPKKAYKREWGGKMFGDRYWMCFSTNCQNSHRKCLPWGLHHCIVYCTISLNCHLMLLALRLSSARR